MRKLGIFLITVLFLAAGCNKDRLVGEKDPATGPEVQAHFKLNSAPMVEKGIKTKSTPAADVNDTQIADIWVLQFDKASGRFIKKFYSSTVNVDAFDAPLVANAPSTTSNIYFVANNGPNLPSPADEAAFKTQMKSITQETNLFVIGTDSKKSIPMFGQLLNVFVPATGYLETMNVTLTRILARVDLTYTMDASIADKLELEQVRLVNITNFIQYYPPVTATFPVTPGETNMMNLPIELATSPGPTTISFYVPENMRGVGTNTAGSNERLKSGVYLATYIELIGHTKGATGGDEISYRIYPGADNFNDYNLVRNTHYTLSTTLMGVSASDNRVRVKERSNCYMLIPGQTVNIPVKHANDCDLGTQLPDVTTGWTPSINWQTVSGLVTIDNSTSAKGYFKVTAPSTSLQGNAEVMIKDGSGKILWSWHIWVTKYDPSFVTNVDAGNGFSWMKLNLGALNIANGSPDYSTAAGLFYQWGRKDPFQPTLTNGNGGGSCTVYSYSAPTYSDISVTNIPGDPSYQAATPTSNYLAYSVKYPTLFLTTWKGSTFVNGLSTGADSWGGEYGQPKSVYDPCPEGWRVPSGKKTSATFTHPWSGFSATNYVQNSGTGCYIAAGSIYYSLAGYRGSNGQFNTVGSQGDYWTATCSAVDSGMYGVFSSTFGQDWYPKDWGMMVRCVKVW